MGRRVDRRAKRRSEGNTTMISISRMRELVEKQSITAKEFIEKNEKEDLCFETCDGKISDDFEDWFEEHKDCVEDKNSLEEMLEIASVITVYKKIRFKLDKNFVIDYIEDYLSDNWGFDICEHGNISDYVGKDIFEEFCNKFNKSFDYYIEGKQVYSLDLSKEFDEYLKDELGEDYPKEQTNDS